MRAGMSLRALRTLGLAALTATAAFGASHDAVAQLVVGKSAPHSGQQRVVVFREGERSIVTLSAKVDPKAGRVAWLFPIQPPDGGSVDLLGATSVDRKVLSALDEVSGPKVSEYWELDPCELHTAVGPGPDRSSPSKKDDADEKSPDATLPAFELSLVRGKIDDVKAALEAKGFVISDASRDVLATYLDEGKTLVVAEIATKDLANGQLPPLRLETSASPFTLPVRLAASAGKGTSLEIFVIAPEVRFEAENRPNFATLTNLDVKVAAKAGLPSFFDGVRATLWKDHPEALLTEYAWRASGCDQCGAPLTQPTLEALGLTVLPSAKNGQQGEVLIHAESVSNQPGGPDAMRAALTSCYAAALAKSPGLEGIVALDVVVANGVVTSATPRDEVASGFGECASAAVKAADLDRSGAMSVELVPMSRKYFADLVLTRLAARFDAVPEEDLRLRPARAIEGGREEGADGKPVQKVYWGETGNNFQSRYVVRHPWKGKIACHSPRRGFWGGPPKGEKLSKFGTKKIAQLGDVVVGALPDSSAFEIAYEAPPAPPPTPSATPDPAGSGDTESGLPLPSASAGVPAPAPQDDGCGCTVAASVDADWRAVVALAFGSAASARRRLRRRHR